MPASTLDPVNAAIRTSLNKNESAVDSLDAQLAGSTSKALLANIEFEPAGTYQAVLDKIKSKYNVLKSAETPQPSKPEGDVSADETLKLPSLELYPLESVQLGWSKSSDWSVGAGMINMGNTCYLNSTLQALFHVPAFVNWLMSDKEHSADCQDSGGLCIICAMRKTLQDSQQRNTSTIRPLLIYNKLRLVCRNLIPGRQEDAHEFLRYLVEAMEKSYLNRFKNHSEFDSKVKETTPLNQILGGYLRSAVRCLKCGHVSTTFQHFQDLLLDIRKPQNLDEALEVYFSREKLDDDSYHCQSCQEKVPATKQFSLERTPMVLCVQFKRFSISNNKITKYVNFRQRLDLTRYARHRPSVPLIYRLVALVTHMGPTVNCGHYTAVAQAPNGSFYQFDDSMVRVISHQAVFNTNAYIMFYELESSPFTNTSQKQNGCSTIKTNKSALPTSETNKSINNSNNINPVTPNKVPSGIGFTSDKVYGPQLPPGKLDTNKTNGNTMNGNGKHQVTTTDSSDSDGENNGPSSSTNNSGNGEQQKENTRPINSNSNGCEKNSTNSSKKILFSLHNKNNDSTNKNGNVIKTSTPQPNFGESKKKEYKIVATTTTTTTTKLVPYETDDSSGSEESNQSDGAPKTTLITNPQESNGKVSSKPGIGEWKVTESTVALPTQNNKSWNDSNTNSKKKLEVLSSSSASTSSTSTVNELFKMSHSGYSAPVATWNGTRSQLDKEISNERREQRKRAVSDNSDQGKVKHQKLNNNSYKSNPGYNPVQEFHNSKNWGQNNYKFYRSRRNFSKHKTFRFRQ